MSDLGHGALCACAECQYARAERHGLADYIYPARYTGRPRRTPTDAELTGLVLFDLSQINDLKALARSMQPATDDLKGDDLI